MYLLIGSSSISLEDVALNTSLCLSDDSNYDDLVLDEEQLNIVLTDGSDSEQEEDNGWHSNQFTPPSPRFGTPSPGSQTPSISATPSNHSISSNTGLLIPMKGVKITRTTTPSNDKLNSSSPVINKIVSSQSLDISEEEEENGSYLDYDPSGEDEDELSMSSQPEALMRLTSLEARRHTSLINEEEEGENDSNDESDNDEATPTNQRQRLVPKKSKLRGPIQLEPVGLFWDIENCPVPFDKSAFALANKMRSQFFEGKREAEFMCVCDITKERKEVIDDLHKAHVCLFFFYL